LTKESIRPFTSNAKFRYKNTKEPSPCVKGLLNEEYIIPTMEEWEVFPMIAAAVGAKAVEQGVARKVLSRDELYASAVTLIKQSREVTQLMMQNGIIAEPPESL